MDQSDGLPTKEANQQTEKRTMSFPDVDDTTIIIPNKPIFDYKEKSIGKKRAQTFDVEHGIIREKIEMSILRIRFLDGTEMQIQKISTDLVNFINPVLKKRKMLTIIDLKETLGEIDKLEEEGVRLEYTIQKNELRYRISHQNQKPGERNDINIRSARTVYDVESKTLQIVTKTNIMNNKIFGLENLPSRIINKLIELIGENNSPEAACQIKK